MEGNVLVAATTTTFVALVALLICHARGLNRGKWVAKPLASAGFIGTALASACLETPYGTGVLVALVLGLLGDVLLIPQNKRTFVLGLLVFLLGHLAYGVAFVVRGVNASSVAVTAALLTIPFALSLGWLWPHLPRQMRAPIVTYMLIISSMVALAAGTCVHGGDAKIAVGATLFYLSDLTVARRRYVSPGLANRLIGLPLYYGGQTLLALSAAAANG